MTFLRHTTVFFSALLVFVVALAPVCLETKCPGGCPHEDPAAQQQEMTMGKPTLAPAVVVAAPNPVAAPSVSGTVIRVSTSAVAEPPDPLCSRLII